MNRKFFLICLVLCLAPGAIGCGGGEKEAACDAATHKPRCAGANVYTLCIGGAEMTETCPAGQICAETEETAADGSKSISASCKPQPAPETECASDSDCADASKPFCVGGTCAAERPSGVGCAADSDCADASKPFCIGGTCAAERPSGAGCASDSDCADAAKPFCVGGTCVAADPCKDVTCAEGTCDRGVCVTDGMRALTFADECGDDFAEFCNGDKKVTCSPQGLVSIADCSAYGGCAIISETDGGKTKLLAWCNSDLGGDCAEDGEKIGYCASDSDSGKSYESYFVCKKTTEGKFTIQDYFAYDRKTCVTSCNAGNTACIADACEKENETVTACWLEGNYAAKKTCEKLENGGMSYFVTDIVSPCANGCENGACKKLFDEAGSACGADTVFGCAGEDGDVATSCRDGYVVGTACEGRTECLTVAEGNYAGCFDPSEGGCRAGDKKTSCESDLLGKKSAGYVCRLMSDGTTQYVPDSEIEETRCLLGCNSQETGCLIAVDETSGTCTADGESYCKARLQSENAKCASVKGYAECYVQTCEASQAGTVLGNESCSEEYGNELHVYDSCFRADDGTHFVKETSEACIRGCDEDGISCIKYADDEGKPCSDDFAPRCDGGGAYAVTCADGVVKASKCGSQKCGLFADRSAACYADGQTACAEAGAKRKKCYAEQSHEFSFSMACKTLTDGGGNVEIAEDYDVCHNGCDETTGECKPEGV